MRLLANLDRDDFATARPCVGTLVPFVSLRGAIATQARVNTDLGRQATPITSRNHPHRPHGDPQIEPR